MTDEFAETGTKDYTSYLGMYDALQFRQGLGGDTIIMPYIRTLAWQGAQILSEAFGNTPTMAQQDATSGLFDVQLPVWASQSKLANLTTDLIATRNTFVVRHSVLFFWFF
jgi:hypothetical protein